MHQKNLLKIGFVALLCFFITPVFAQKTITGKVTDSKTGEPISGVSILPQGSSAGTTTDINGNFKIAVHQNVAILVVTFVGYEKVEIDVTKEKVLNIRLVEKTISLNEVSVVGVGYGTQQKKDVTGAETSISSKDFNKGEIINPASQLQGKVAGLVITIPGGDPNAIATIHLRGQTSISGDQSPLFVVDGIPLDDASQFQTIPPGDIESYDVLKDASATAIYGSRGANGVILVNTKKGRAGKTLVEYNGYAAVDKASAYYDLLNTSEYKQAISSFPNANTYDKGGNVDWQRAILRTAYTHSNEVAISGGSDNFNYRGSVNFQDQQGVVINSGKQQLGVRFNAEQKALDGKLDITVGFSNISTTHKYVDYNIFTYIFNTPPTYPVYNPDGSYYIFTDFDQANAVEHANEPYNMAYEYQTLINGTADYTLFPGFKIGVTGATTRHNTQTHYFIPQFPQEGNDNSASDENINQNYYNGNIHLHYDKTFGKHSITFTGVYEYNDDISDNFGASGRQYLVPGNLDNNLGAGNALYNLPNSYKEEYELASFLGRINYNYNETYYVTASFRRDGTSKTGNNFPWGNFPSLDAAVRLKKILLNDIDWIEDIKVRAGYGVVGNQDAIGPYGAIPLFGPTFDGETFHYYDPSNPAFPYPLAYGPVQNANPDLKWEERHGKNIGFEYSLFDGRVSGDVNYYDDVTTNMLFDYSVPTPPFIFNEITANIGSLRNRGLEMSAEGDAVKGDNFTWNLSGELNIPNTEVTKLSGTYDGYALTTNKVPLGYAAGRGLSTAAITLLKKGYSPYVFYLPHYTGVDANGNQEFDGKTLKQDKNPKKYYIDPSEKFDYGLTNTFEYKGWSLSFFLRGVYGQKAFNNTLLDFETITRLPGNNIIQGALTNGIKDKPTVSDLWLENASYLRLENATLGYTFKKIKGIQALHVYLSANNVFVITKYKGIDPEISVADNDQAYIDTDYEGAGYYPKTRSFLIGASVSFK